jgi:hypothetical protein
VDHSRRLRVHDPQRPPPAGPRARRREPLLSSAKRPIVPAIQMDAAALSALQCANDRRTTDTRIA